MRKIIQHYVSQEYLKAWTVDGLIACCRNGNIYRANTSKVASERLFYELQELDKVDRDFIEAFAIEPSPPVLKSIHRTFLRYYRAPWIMKRHLQHSPNPAALAKIDEAIANFEEDYQAAIERDFAPILRAMRDRDLSFYADPDQTATFFFSLNVQFLRTKRAREALAKTVSATRYDISRSWNVLSHIFAKNAALSYFRGKENHRLVLVENRTDMPFITGDQPVINLRSDPFTQAPPDRMDLYYPLSPTVAMFLFERQSGQGVETFSDQREVHAYNLLIAQHAHEQIFSADPVQLSDLWRQRTPTSEPEQLRRQHDPRERLPLI
jgi:hypothetical protein